MVDTPTGYHDNAPGRMSAIYTAGLMARNREEGETDVFVHDVDRVVEDKFSKAFLCAGYLTEQEGRIRHFTIPSHRARLLSIEKKFTIQLIALLRNGNGVSLFNVVVITTYKYYIFLAINAVGIT
ncbi:hypothetical protein SO802_024757 [Lithocarpus litseifolius]|uniref:Polysaccharide biosynthesis domain-containing protein n=1 Tax=Lithocarpus litseifolius TaxID=425828 RepID=A0AAW2CD42_9ROSI